MEFLQNNWIWILLIVLFIWMFSSGAGCGGHGSHGGHGGQGGGCGGHVSGTGQGEGESREEPVEGGGHHH